MADTELIEPFAVDEIFVNGFTKHKLRDGVMTCAGYRTTEDGQRLVVVRLVWPAMNTEAAIEDAKSALASNCREAGQRGVH